MERQELAAVLRNAMLPKQTPATKGLMTRKQRQAARRSGKAPPPEAETERIRWKEKVRQRRFAQQKLYQKYARGFTPQQRQARADYRTLVAAKHVHFGRPRS